MVIGLFWFRSVEAASCQCYNQTGGLSKVPLGSCEVNIPQDYCYPRFMGYQDVANCIATGEYGTQNCDYRSCTPYRDNACQVPIGTLDPNSKFNPCWTREQCENAGGDFDEEGRDSPNCRPLGNEPTARCFVKPAPVSLQIPIPGLTEFDERGRAVVRGGFPGYLAIFYKFFIAMLAVISVVMVMWGGFKRIMAAGSPERMKAANETIGGAITGLVLALVSFSLLQLINPALVNSTRLKLDKVKGDYYGDWCPAVDPVDSSITYQCGDEATVNGQACIGSVCQVGGRGCYKVDKTGERDSTGKLKDYQCLTPQEACESVTESVAEDVYGLDKFQRGFFTSFDALCSRFSQGGNRCVRSGSRCYWITEGYLANLCAGKTQCTDFNSEPRPAVSVACYHKLCSAFPNCKWKSISARVGECENP